MSERGWIGRMAGTVEMNSPQSAAPAAAKAHLPLRSVKIYGERNTGTNYLAQLIRANFNVKMLRGSQPISQAMLSDLTQNLNRGAKSIGREMLIDVSMAEIRNGDFGWKHGVPPFDALTSQASLRQGTLFIVVSKHPADWLRSFHRRPYHCLFNHNNMSFPEFMRHPWICTSKEGIQPAVTRNIIDLWNLKHRSWLQLANCVENCVFIRYNQLLEEFQPAMTLLSGKIPRKNRPIANIEKSVKQDRMTNRDYKRKYLNSDIYAEFEADDIEFFRAEIDREVASSFGYDI